MAHQARAAEDAEQGVVILRRDGIELVVVAASAGHGRRLKGFRERVDLVVKQVIADRSEADAVIVIDLAEAIEASPNDRLVDLLLLVPARAEPERGEALRRGQGGGGCRC